MKTMLSIITLETIDKIFSERFECKVQPMSKILYINCLMGHFKNLEANEKNAIAFELFYSDIKGYETWKNNFTELHKAKATTLTPQFIIFNNLWGRYIDRSSFNEKGTAIYESQLKTADHFKQELLGNQTMFEVTGMKHKLSKESMVQLIDLFVKEQEAISTKYENASECTRHFIYWARSNGSKLQTMPDVVKSTGKILGKY
jgi:hypothetical protein